MRKMSSYARRTRRLEAGGSFANGAGWLNVIQRSRQYTDELIPGSFLEGGGETMSAATLSLLRVREALDSMLRGGIQSGDTRPLDLLDHAIGVSWLRLLQIAGDDPVKNPALPILKEAQAALHRTNECHTKTGLWGFDGEGAWKVREAIDIYAEVLISSSPAQMTDACNKREQILRDKLRKST